MGMWLMDPNYDGEGVLELSYREATSRCMCMVYIWCSCSRGASLGKVGK